ncbi:hypothetical protein [Oceanirhabdus seepicola]|uniref:DUF2383 domain-containing protein n=1 Tax=Oceanirhabdus seepicola TaxID=2828781 RepID=A0A9J6P515_9CLOT|nr:hypothetical protein [Oceanirhabdus seepicola]MCM1991783.1 hypothetical protein [Oceanirhabdus seepicola]
MNMDTRDILIKKLNDAEENVRDYQAYSENVDNGEVGSVFGKFAEESAIQAAKLQELLDKYDNR